MILPRRFFKSFISLARHKTVSYTHLGGSFLEIPDRKEAITYSITHAEPGDMIAIIGKGHEDYQEINGVRYPFLDRAVVEEVVKNL